MARRPFLIPFLLWTSIPTVASIPTVSSYSLAGLGSDITTIVPACAQECLVSFVEGNFPSPSCDSSYSLSCLCSENSTSGYTVGEGALQCLLGEFSLGQCDHSDLGENAAHKVLHMCDGQPNALPETHAVLTATLVIGGSGGASLVVPTPSWTTVSTLTRSTGITTPSETTMTMSMTSPSPSTMTITSSHGSTSVTMSTSTTSSTTTPVPNSTSNPTSSKELAPAQIAGIAVSAVGAVAIAVGAIFLARCLRKRKCHDSESEKGLYQISRNTTPDLNGPRGSRVFHISPPILRKSRYGPQFSPRPAPPIPPVSRARPGVQPTQGPRRSTIGLAISRPPSQRLAITSIVSQSPGLLPRPIDIPLERKPSKLLPNKPTLTLDIPRSTAVASAPSSQAPPTTTDRASTLTNMTAFADLDAEAAEGGQIWRPPPTDPQSATTLYVADKYGNWVLSNDNRLSQIQAAQIMEAAELDTYTPLTKSPIEKREEAEAAKMSTAISAAASLPIAPQPAFLSQDPSNWTAPRGGSSVYSQASGGRPFARRNSSSKSGSLKSRKGSGRMSRTDSQGSATTIHTSSSGDMDDYPVESDVARLSQLSPVEESPDLGIRRPQVTYPKIPGRLGGATIRYVPPPRRPNFTGSPPGQPSPTLGAVYAVRDSPGAYPLPLNPRRSMRPFAPNQKVGSGFSPEPFTSATFTSQCTPRPTKTPPPAQSTPKYVPNVVRESPRVQRQPGLRTPPQQAVATFTPSPPSGEVPTAPFKPPTPPPTITKADAAHLRVASQATMSPMSSRTISSNASSLLAKRLGSDRAAALALDPSVSNAQRWTRQGGGLLSPYDVALASGKGTLPMTPTWLPKLTPTRRGDDLFLNVQ
ncbi:hypothetical protein F5Y18DRAFT_341672 [Xylariaceae sp. FL1019]|nr:hypothetical protein F5Y18DRAFT_341672 [Xylariaceae sp. FL1019]